MRYVAVALGGAVGAVLRYGLIGWNSILFPFGTLAVNLMGCFLLGGFLTAIQRFGRIPPGWQIGIATGMIGSFTTFSTFTVEIVQLMASGEGLDWLLAMVYVAVSVLGGCLLAWSGMKLADTFRVQGER